MAANLAGRPAVHLRVIEVRGLGGIGVDKPGVDVVGGIFGIIGLPGHNPCQGVVEHRVRHCLKGSCIVDKQPIFGLNTIAIAGEREVADLSGLNCPSSSW